MHMLSYYHIFLFFSVKILRFTGIAFAKCITGNLRYTKIRSAPTAGSIK